MGTASRLRMPRDFRWCERLMPSPKDPPDQANCARRARPAMTVPAVMLRNPIAMTVVAPIFWASGPRSARPPPAATTPTSTP